MSERGTRVGLSRAAAALRLAASLLASAKRESAKPIRSQSPPAIAKTPASPHTASLTVAGVLARAGRPWVSLIALTAGGLFLPVSGAEAAGQRTPPLQAISRTPVLPRTSACVDRHDGSPSTDVEPTIAVNPRNPENLIAGWWTGQAGFKRLAVAGGYAVTHDGGRSWRTGVPQRVDSCSGRPSYWVAGSHDEWLAFAPNGRAYMLVESGRHLALPIPDPIEAGNTNTIWLYMSEDEGRTWSRPVAIAKASVDTGGPDQPRLTVDPTDQKRLYVFWRQIPPSAFKIGEIGNAPGYFSSSTDSGRTWSKPRRIITPPTGVPEGPQMQHPYVLANGTVVDIFDEQNFLNIDSLDVPAQVMAIRSENHGATWSKPVVIATHTSLQFFTDPNGGDVRAIGTGASAAIGPNGALYAAWADRHSGQPLLRVLLSKSSDGGRTWSKPSQVGHSDIVSIGPTVAVAGDGTVGVLYYDNRNDRPHDSSWTTDVYLAYARPGSHRWREHHLAGPFNLAAAPVEGQESAVHRPQPYHFLGDYFGLAGLPRGFVAAFTMAKPRSRRGRTDIFFASTHLPPTR